jgi:hypothetical protein
VRGNRRQHCWGLGFGVVVDPGWTLSADEVVSLPIDELAIALLHDVLATNKWNSSNWMLTARSAYSGRPDAVNALSEAWGWLYAKSLVAPALEKQTLGAMFVTRRGREAVENGLASVRAAERLDVDLPTQR